MKNEKLKCLASITIQPVCLGSLSCWNVNLLRNLKSFALWSRFSRICLYLAPFIVPSILYKSSSPCHWKASPELNAVTPMLHGWDGVRWVISCALFPPDVRLCIQAKEFNFPLIRSQNLLHHDLRVFHVPFGKLQPCCHVPFSQEWLPSGHSPIKRRFVKCCRDCCPSGRLFHLSQGTL